MAYVITDDCTKCMNCTEICPVSCIHPGEDELGLNNVSQLYIDPSECIDCGACAEECPAEAIFLEDELPPDKKPFTEINRDYYKG